MTSLSGARILIVDDQPANVRLLEKLLSRAGYTNMVSTTDPREAESLFVTRAPDIVVLDLNMPYLDGFAVMDRLRPHIPDQTYLPILVLTADASSETKKRALSAGAMDFLTKPFDHVEVELRLRHLLDARFLHLQLRNQNTILEDKVRERTHDLEEAQHETLHRLALAAEYRDDDTGQHIQRVARISSLIAAEMGLDPHEVETIGLAAPLHDVGKIGVPDSILLKPGPLTPEEISVMRQHTIIGSKILSGSRSLVLQTAETIALTHHERWDGGGYAGMVGSAIPLAGRIVAVADVWDALTHDRPYKKAWEHGTAHREMVAQSGAQFDPMVIEAFARIVDTLTRDSRSNAVV